MAVVVLVVVVWGPKGSVASCRADVLVVKHYSVFYVLSVCSRCTVLGSRRGALLVVWWGVTRWAGAAPFGRVVVVVVVVEGVLVVLVVLLRLDLERVNSAGCSPVIRRQPGRVPLHI